MFPEVTPTATMGIEANPKSSPIPSSTPTNTPTPETAPNISLQPIEQSSAPIATARQPLRQGVSKSLDEGGFSFRRIIGCEDTYLPGQVTLTCEDGVTFISMIGAPFSSTGEIEDILFSFLETLSGTFQTFDAEPPYPFSVAGSQGLAADVTGEMGETPFFGRVVIVVPTEEQLFYALGISASGPAGDGWEPGGRQAFEAVINSIEFYKPVINHE